MPKLSIDQLIKRLQNRIEQLENNELLEARDFNSLLNKKQKQAFKDAWNIQKYLRKIHKIPKTDQYKKKIDWKTIREVRLEIYKQALLEAKDGLLESYEKKLKELEIKQAKIYVKTYFDNIKNGFDKIKAASRANKKLTMHGLRRVDCLSVGKIGLNKQVNEMEDDLRKRFERELNKDKKN